MVNDKFVPTSNENAILICGILKCEFHGLSRIDGKPIITISKDDNSIDKYRKYLDIQIIPIIEDYIPYFTNINYVRPIHPFDDKIVMKILNHDPSIILLREEKLKRILENAHK